MPRRSEPTEFKLPDEAQVAAFKLHAPEPKVVPPRKVVERAPKVEPPRVRVRVPSASKAKEQRSPRTLVLLPPKLLAAAGRDAARLGMPRAQYIVMATAAMLEQRGIDVDAEGVEDRVSVQPAMPDKAEKIVST
jgi:hypothetical protein